MGQSLGRGLTTIIPISQKCIVIVFGCPMRCQERPSREASHFKKLDNEDGSFVVAVVIQHFAEEIHSNPISLFYLSDASYTQ